MNGLQPLTEDGKAAENSEEKKIFFLSGI